MCFRSLSLGFYHFLCSDVNIGLGLLDLIFNAVHGVRTICGSTTSTKADIANEFVPNIGFRPNLRQETQGLVAAHDLNRLASLAGTIVVVSTHLVAVVEGPGVSAAIGPHHESVERLELRCHSHPPVE